jgi:hypothetical protein
VFFRYNRQPATVTGAGFDGKTYQVMNNLSPGLQKQDALLNKIHSTPLDCPHCGSRHSYIEARGSNDWTKDYPVKCPETGGTLIHNVPQLGENYFTKAPMREMTLEEEQDWQSLDDNMDWMSDQQIKDLGDKIRTKYKK